MPATPPRLDKIAYRLNSYKGTIEFAKKGLGNNHSLPISVSTSAILTRVMRELEELKYSIQLDYDLYKMKLRREQAIAKQKEKEKSNG